MKTTGLLSAFTVACAVGSPASAIEFQLDYSLDSSGFFTTNPDAKTALEAAADLLSDIITTSLTATVDLNESVLPSANSSFNFSYGYTNPSTGAQLTLNNAALAADTIRVFVGARNIVGNALGAGGPAGAGVDAAFGYGGFVSDIEVESPQTWATARDAAELNIRRGGGPVFGNLSGTLTDSNGIVGPYSYDFDTGVGVGSVWFDTGADWHFPHTTAVEFSKVDFYSVALHELIHVLGIGTSDTWEDLTAPADANDWLGSQVIALLGSGDNVLDNDGAHLLSGIQSTHYLTGAAQEAVMDPNITNGTRKDLTALDIAFLEDLGYTIVVALPGDLNQSGGVDAVDIDLLGANLGTASGATPTDGDLDGDGDVDNDDLNQMITSILSTFYGDTDLDGDVDGFDFNTFAINFGNSSGWAAGDFDLDGDVDGFDFNTFAINFGSGVPAAQLGAVAAIPEPATGLVLMAGAGLIARSRGRRPTCAPSALRR